MPKKLTIKQMRLLSGYTLEQVANQVNISREHLGKVENDEKSLAGLKTGTLKQLVEFYGYSLEDLFF